MHACVVLLAVMVSVTVLVGVTGQGMASMMMGLGAGGGGSSMFGGRTPGNPSYSVMPTAGGGGGGMGGGGFGMMALVNTLGMDGYAEFMMCKRMYGTMMRNPMMLTRFCMTQAS